VGVFLYDCQQLRPYKFLLQYISLIHSQKGRQLITCTCCFNGTLGNIYFMFSFLLIWRGRRARDRMIVRFTTTCGISAYHHYSCEFVLRSWRGVFDTTLCDKVSVTCGITE
jgi:hypothetical protein